MSVQTYVICICSDHLFCMTMFSEVTHVMSHDEEVTAVTPTECKNGRAVVWEPNCQERSAPMSG